MRIYDYLFFRLNQLVTLFDYETYFASTIIMCWLFLFNSLTVFYFLSFQFDIKETLNIYASTTGGIIMVGGHLFYFLRSGKIGKIEDRFKDEDRTSAIVGLVVAILYIGLTNWLFWVVAAPNMGGIAK